MSKKEKYSKAIAIIIGFDNTDAIMTYSEQHIGCENDSMESQYRTSEKCIGNHYVPKCDKICGWYN